jgi:hypothetical protein
MTSRRQENGLPQTLPDRYLLECEMRARQFSGAFTGTSGTLAAMVLNLLKEVSRLKGEAAVQRARAEERRATVSY